MTYCEELIQKNYEFVIEEKFIGQEFSLMSFSDGKTLKHMPVIQDHKRAYEGDEGPNTGGMGTYSDKDHSLPFLNKEDVNKAKETNEKIIRALYKKFGDNKLHENKYTLNFKGSAGQSFGAFGIKGLKLNLKGMDENDIPKLKKTFFEGIHFLVPIFVLIYLLVYMRLTASYSIFFATITLIIVNLLNKIFKEKNFKNALIYWYNQTVVGFEKGALNMVSVGIAIATAGIIVGAVGSTGLSTNLIIVIESIAKDNVIILLFLTIILCLLLGMGLPTTANYVVVASLMATVLVDVGNASGFIFPLIAVHLFVFYFGLMADVTPPVGLASYAAAAISGGDPLRTGAQAFWYSLRTGILPIVFLFNSELLLIGIESIWHGLMVIATSLIGILVFTSATQGWFINKLRWYEIIIFLIISISLLSPEFILNKFYPKYNYLSIEEINKKQFDYNKEIRIKITRLTEYGERYKLFVIEKNSFDENFSLDDYGMSLVVEDNKTIIDTLKWNGIAKKSGLDMGDIINEFKIENQNRPKKEIIYPIALILLSIFGYLNIRRRI